MAKLLKLRRGTTSQHNTFTGAEGEVTIDTTKDTAVVHDGSTAGGTPLAKEDMSNVSSSSIAGRLGADAIATTKIAGGTLPSDVKITDANVSGNLTIANADINADAVNGSKIADNSINSEHYVDGSIDRVHLAGDIVDGSKIADNSINSEHYVDGSIDTAHIADNQVTFSKLQNIYTQTIMGRLSSGTGDPTMLNASDVRTIINVENGATADQSNAEIRAAVEAASDSNVFTDADHNKLNGIESGATADQSASEILTAIKTVDGSGSGLDADTLDGAQPSDAASGGTIVKRNSSGYVFANYFNTTANDVTSGVTKVMVETGNDNYIRHGSAGAIRSFINVENGATADQTGSEIATSIRGQTLGTSSDGVHDVYNDGWFRNNESGEGIYNQATTQHFYSDNDDYWNIAGGGSANGLRFRDDHNSTVRGYVYANNANQIGFLNSGASWSLKCDNSGNVTATGNVTAYSDKRLKTNINTINDALSIVGKLRGVSFDWKESGKRSIGVIAQEVEKVLPELVLTQQVLDPTGQSEIKSVDYGKIVGVLINAINELKAEVDKLKGGK